MIKEYPHKSEYIILNGRHYRKDWRGDCWIYHLMELGYEIATYSEDEFNNLKKLLG